VFPNRLVPSTYNLSKKIKCELSVANDDNFALIKSDLEKKQKKMSKVLEEYKEEKSKILKKYLKKENYN